MFTSFFPFNHTLYYLLFIQVCWKYWCGIHGVVPGEAEPRQLGINVFDRVVLQHLGRWTAALEVEGDRIGGLGRRDARCSGVEEEVRDERAHLTKREAPGSVVAQWTRR